MIRLPLRRMTGRQLQTSHLTWACALSCSARGRTAIATLATSSRASPKLEPILLSIRVALASWEFRGSPEMPPDQLSETAWPPAGDRALVLPGTWADDTPPRRAA